jgi:hypothetical protein
MSYNYTMPHDLTAADLRTMDDATLLAHEDHYGAVLASCQEDREVQTELLTLTEMSASDVTRTWLTRTAEMSDRQITQWMRALQMTCTERKRRDEDSRQDAYNVSLLYNTAELLTAHGLHDCALKCNELAQSIADNNPFDAPSEEATAGAGL